MLTPRLNNCVNCTTIPSLLGDIDCRLTILAKRQYSNIVFMLNNQLPNQAIFDMLQYKRILQFKYCNADYASCYSVDNIASRIKILIHK